MLSKEILAMLDREMPRELRRALQDWYKASPLEWDRALSLLAVVVMGLEVRFTTAGPFTPEEQEFLRAKRNGEDGGALNVIVFPGPKKGE